ncbi:MAG: ribosomal RNA small subunit methyltransferase A [Candidatus Omnitrophica bacterium]|nr:ribosomal RNA small subunit methyltransferase A [Candidatus Omnitrophota bacterium]
MAIDPHTTSELRRFLEAHQIRLHKRLGQNYLVDPQLARRIVEACELADDDDVVEIGPGLGALTGLLAARARRVTAVELDGRIARLLAQRLALSAQVQVVHQDILEFPWSQHPGSIVVGNIPYQITSPLLAILCDPATPVRTVWLGMQREVAQRLCARPGTRTYGRITLLVASRFSAEPVLTLPKRAFFPQPRVDSVWLRLRPHAQPRLSEVERPYFFAVVRAAFSQRRKMLLNCLAERPRARHSAAASMAAASQESRGLAITREQAQEALRRAGLPERVRGEELSFEAFRSLAQAVTAMKHDASDWRTAH